MTIQGIWAEDAATLDREQWVNVYEVDVLGDAVFYLTCQAKDLGELINTKESDYALELTTEEGE